MLILCLPVSHTEILWYHLLLSIQYQSIFFKKCIVSYKLFWIGSWASKHLRDKIFRSIVAKTLLALVYHSFAAVVCIYFKRLRRKYCTRKESKKICWFCLQHSVSLLCTPGLFKPWAHIFISCKLFFPQNIWHWVKQCTKMFCKTLVFFHQPAFLSWLRNAK